MFILCAAMVLMLAAGPGSRARAQDDNNQGQDDNNQGDDSCGGAIVAWKDNRPDVSSRCEEGKWGKVGLVDRRSVAY